MVVTFIIIAWCGPFDGIAVSVMSLLLLLLHVKHTIANENASRPKFKMASQRFTNRVDLLASLNILLLLLLKKDRLCNYNGTVEYEFLQFKSLCTTEQENFFLGHFPLFPGSDSPARPGKITYHLLCFVLKYKYFWMDEYANGSKLFSYPVRMASLCLSWKANFMCALIIE